MTEIKTFVLVDYSDLKINFMKKIYEKGTGSKFRHIIFLWSNVLTQS